MPFLRDGAQLAIGRAMTVSGLVLTLENEAIALAALAKDSRVVCGEAHGLRLPVVTETGTPEEAEELCESLAKLPGVLFVDVVSIAFDTEVM